MRSILIIGVLVASVGAARAVPNQPASKKPVEQVDPKPVEPTPEPPGDADHKPWYDGVPEATQQQAHVIFADGNTLFSQQQHAPALEKYRVALALWEHPLIRFNLAVTEIRLERVLEAADDLEKALQFGAAPFTPELYQQALDYQSLLKGRVGYIEASCTAQASVQLDGKQWFSCPGTKRVRVIAGEHTLVSERPGYLTNSRRVVVPGGKTITEKLVVVSIESAVVLEYPYRQWIPWTITATGAAIALGGAGLWFAGRNQMTEFDANFSSACTVTGCEPDLSQHPALRDQRDSAAFKGTVGISLMIGGGAVAVGGIVMAIINRPKRIMPNIEVTPTADGIKTQVGWKF